MIVRHPTAFTRTSTIALFLVASVGCNKEFLFAGGAPQRTTAPHPAAGDVQEIPPLSYPAAALETQRGLPTDALRQDVQLIRADAESLCFRVTLRGLSRSYADLRGWKAALRTSAGEQVQEHPMAPQIEAEEVHGEIHDGIVPVQVQTGSQTECVEKDKYEQCMKTVEKPIISTTWQPGTVEVSTGGGTVCFPGQALGPNTRKVALRLNLAGKAPTFKLSFGPQAPAPTDEGPTRLTFQWEFSGP